MNWPQIFLDGLLLGTLYALIALGYTMVYGVLRFINFAHGEMFMLGAYAGTLAAPLCVRLCGGQPSFAAAALVVAVAMAVGALTGMTIEAVAYRPLRERPRITALITAIGVSLLLQNLAQILFGATPRTFPATLPDLTWHPFGLTLPAAKAVVLVVTPVLLLSLTLLVMRTRLGLAMRAIAFNPAATQLMGVSPNRVVAFTFALGSALAAAGGVLHSFCYPTGISPMLGTMPGLKAFAAAVVGGIGSLPGAALGALLLGIIENFVGASPASAYKDTIAFGLLIAVLIVRPAGILGRHLKEKV